MLRIGVRIWVWLERCDAEVVFLKWFLYAECGAFPQQPAGWPNGKALDYESRDCRFDPCVGHYFLFFLFFLRSVRSIFAQYSLKFNCSFTCM